MSFKSSVLILGSSGLLGSELTSGRYLNNYRIISHSHKSQSDLKADLQDYNQVIKMLNQAKPSTIINLVGFTNVDLCEKFPNEAYKLNVKVVQNLVDAINQYSLKTFLIHISTDQVYDGEGILSEKNINLSNYYSFSKYIGELIARQIESVVLRTNFFGKSKNLKRNSLSDWIYYKLSLGENIDVFDDVKFSPLSIYTLCKMIELMVEKKEQGIYNLGSCEGMSKADFAYYFAKMLNFSTSKMNRVKVSNCKFLYAYRPKNMLMKLAKFEKKFNLKLPKLIDEIELVKKEYQK
jgi:dTDP-4-dehydrorhamnose reductase